MRAFVGVGSNLGDRWAHLAYAARRFRAAHQVALVRVSRVYDTDPVGPPQPRYLNAVIELETALTPEALLALLQLVEQGARRKRDVHWGARTLDLDLLLFGDRVIKNDRLILPHPRLAVRRFVLAPLAELCPGHVVPGAGATVAELLEWAPALDMRVAGIYPG